MRVNDNFIKEHEGRSMEQSEKGRMENLKKKKKNVATSATSRLLEGIMRRNKPSIAEEDTVPLNVLS